MTTDTETLENDISQPAEGPQETQSQPEFNLRDLSAVKQIIEVGARRGAWNAAEMSAVGFTYDRLIKFLSYHAPQQEQPAEEPQEEVPAE